jgi:hypothetical protein
MSLCHVENTHNKATTTQQQSHNARRLPIENEVTTTLGWVPFVQFTAHFAALAWVCVSVSRQWERSSHAD